MYKKRRCFSTQVPQDLLITGLWPGKKKTTKKAADSELRKEFTKLRHSDEYAWLLNISNNVTKQAIKDACNAYKNFFKGLKKIPRFKSRKRSMPKFYQDNVKIQFSNTHERKTGSAKRAYRRRLR